MPVFNFLDGTSVSIADLSSVASSIATIATWFWGIFGNLIDTISSNSLFLWPCVFAIGAGTVGLALRIVRAFGLKGRR